MFVNSFDPYIMKIGIDLLHSTNSIVSIHGECFKQSLSPSCIWWNKRMHFSKYFMWEMQVVKKYFHVFIKMACLS